MATLRFKLRSKRRRTVALLVETAARARDVALDVVTRMRMRWTLRSRMVTLRQAKLAPAPVRVATQRGRP